MPALDVCARCGSFVCYDCISSAYGDPACGPCAKVITTIDRTLPPGLKTALGMVVFGLVAFPAGVAGAVLAAVELRRARARSAPAPVEEWAQSAMRASVLTVCLGLYLLWQVYWPALQRLLGR